MSKDKSGHDCMMCSSLIMCLCVCDMMFDIKSIVVEDGDVVQDHCCRTLVYCGLGHHSAGVSGCVSTPGRHFLWWPLGGRPCFEGGGFPN